MSRNFNRRRFSRLSESDAKELDYTNVNALRGFLTETGRILPSRITGISVRVQRRLRRQIEIARFLGLIPYCESH